MNISDQELRLEILKEVGMYETDSGRRFMPRDRMTVLNDAYYWVKYGDGMEEVSNIPPAALERLRARFPRPEPRKIEVTLEIDGEEVAARLAERQN